MNARKRLISTMDILENYEGWPMNPNIKNPDKLFKEKVVEALVAIQEELENIKQECAPQ